MRKLLVIAVATLASCGQGSAPEQKADTPVMAAIDSPAIAKTDSVEPSAPTFAAIMQKKKEEGIDFYGVGQEPGWTLNIARDSIISFSAYNGVSMNTPWVQPTVKGDTSIYNMITETGRISVTVVRGECSDVMSGQKFSHSVSIKLKRGVDKDFMNFKGCGTLVD